MTDPGAPEREPSRPDPYSAPSEVVPPPPPQYGYTPPSYGYTPPQYGYAPQAYGYGVPGQIRPTGKSIAIFFCTLGIYMYVYNFKVHDEMKRYSGRGIGGGIALLLTFLGQVAMPFVTPAEVGSLYVYRGLRPPVRGWLGLWYLLPVVGGYIVIFITAFAVTAATNANGDLTTTSGVVIAVGIIVWFAALIAGGVIWFVKTNDALNRFWKSLGVTPDYRPA